MLIKNIFIDLFNRYWYTISKFKLAKPKFYKFYSFFFLFLVYSCIPFLLIVSTLNNNKNIFYGSLIIIFLLIPVPGFDGEGVLPLIVWVFVYFMLLAYAAIFWPLIILAIFFGIYMLFKKKHEFTSSWSNSMSVWADDDHLRPRGSKGYYEDNDQYLHYQIISPSYFKQIKSYFNYLKSSNLSLIFNFKLINQYDKYLFYPIFFHNVYNWKNIKSTTLYVKFVDLANVRAEISKLYFLFTGLDKISFGKFDYKYFQERFLTTNLSIDQDLFNAKEYLQHLLTFKTKKEKEN